MTSLQIISAVLLGTLIGLSAYHWLQEKRRAFIAASEKRAKEIDARIIELARMANEAKRRKQRSSHIVTDMRRLRTDALRQELGA